MCIALGEISYYVFGGHLVFMDIHHTKEEGYCAFSLSLSEHTIQPTLKEPKNPSLVPTHYDLCMLRYV